MDIKKIIWIVLSSIIPAILLNLGILIIKKEKYVGIITVLIAFALLYFIYYAFQIKENETKIKELEERQDEKEQLLNTIKDIVILKKISRIR